MAQMSEENRKKHIFRICKVCVRLVAIVKLKSVFISDSILKRKTRSDS